MFHVGKMISFAIHLLFHPDNVSRARCLTQFASFALFDINNDSTLNLSHVFLALLKEQKSIKKKQNQISVT